MYGREELNKYYNLSRYHYNLVWNSDSHGMMHYGIHDGEADGFDDAVKRRAERILEKAELNEDSKILEIGCGMGGNAIRLAKLTGAKFIGIDINGEALEIAREKAQEEGVEDLIEFRETDFESIDTEESFDLIFGIETFCYCKDIEGTVSQFSDLLKEDGILILSDGFTDLDEKSGLERYLENKMCRGWLLEGLIHTDDLEEAAEKTPLELDEKEDITERIKPSSYRIFLAAVLLLPIGFLTRAVGKTEKMQVNHGLTGIYQLLTIQKGVLKQYTYKFVKRTS